MVSNLIGLPVCDFIEEHLVEHPLHFTALISKQIK